MNKDWDAFYMRMAFLVAEKSKCVRAKYGSVIVSPDNRVISVGFNGKPKGSINDHICYREGLPDNASKPNCCLHSESNAIMFASPEQRSGSTLYVSGIPCTDCALLIAQSGIKRVVYFNGSSVTGHRGNVDTQFIEKYGMKVKFEAFE